MLLCRCRMGGSLAHLEDGRKLVWWQVHVNDACCLPESKFVRRDAPRELGHAVSRAQGTQHGRAACSFGPDAVAHHERS